MEYVLIDRLERRILCSTMSISCECDDILDAVEKLVQLPDLPQAARDLLQEILDASATIGDEVTEMEGHLSWFKDRMATGGKKND